MTRVIVVIVTGFNVQKFRAGEIHTMKSRDSQCANECLEQLMSYSFR